MTLDPVNFAVAGGNIVSTMTINARKDVPAAEVKIDFKRLQLPKLLPKIEPTRRSGRSKVADPQRGPRPPGGPGSVSGISVSQWTPFRRPSRDVPPARGPWPS